MKDAADSPTWFADFVLQTQLQDIPQEVQARVQDLILDLIGVSAASQNLPASKIGGLVAQRMFGAGGAPAPILFAGATASAAGAAYAGANQIDSLDAHDGFSRAKGHAGCGLLPAVLAFCAEIPNVSGQEFLTAMVLGYEIASRAGIALHGSVSDYHTSGAWVAVAVAALGVRLQGGSAEDLRQAIGIAEYHGPRSQMMREIDNPTMLHDGSGWGAMVGVVAAELAREGFQGAPAITIENPDVWPYWADLGQEWLTLEQNIKLFPICRWAHAPIQGALNLRDTHDIAAPEISHIEIHAFHEATRLARDMPATIARAQYSISYPVAAALVYGQVGAEEVSGARFQDAKIARLVESTTLHECDHCNANFPADRLGRTVVVLKDGRRLDSGIVQAPGEHSNPIDRDGLVEKFEAFVTPVMDPARADAIKAAIFALHAPNAKLSDLTQHLYPKL